VFLPFIGEFGWYLMTYIKMFHASQHQYKIVYTKPGHEFLFPTASEFRYNWPYDKITDVMKAGVSKCSMISEIYDNIKTSLSVSDLIFDPYTITWDDKIKWAQYTFVPKYVPTNVKIDVVICPRNRQIDKHRNWPVTEWQALVDGLKGYNVGVCGTKDTTYKLNNVIYASDYLDVSADIDFMRNSKVTVCQESGLLYLAFMCKSNVIIIDEPHKKINDLHRDKAATYEVIGGGYKPILNRLKMLLSK
jgi:hypothetical protein